MHELEHFTPNLWEEECKAINIQLFINLHLKWQSSLAQLYRNMEFSFIYTKSYTQMIQICKMPVFILI